MSTHTWFAEGVTCDLWLDGYATLLNTGLGDVEVTEVRVHVATETNNNVFPLIPGVFEVRRVSAYVGGIRTIDAVEHDPSSSTLPSEVVCALKPQQVTISGNLFRSECSLANNFLTAPTALRFGRGQGRFNPGIGGPISGTLFAAGCGSGAGTTTGMMLREGEGLTVVYAQRGSGPIRYNYDLVVRVGSAVYRYFIPNAFGRSVGDPHFVLFNGSGSGVVIEVLSLVVSEQGNTVAGTGALYRLARVDGVYGADNEQSLRYGTITNNDPAKGCPSSVVGVLGPHRATLAGEASGFPTDWWTGAGGAVLSIANQHRQGLVRCMRKNWRNNSPASNLAHPTPGEVIYEAKVGSGIVLSENQGLSILAGAKGTLESYGTTIVDVSMSFNYSPIYRHSVIGAGRIVGGA